jgi:hypothetical protein
VIHPVHRSLHICIHFMCLFQCNHQSREKLANHYNFIVPQLNYNIKKYTSCLSRRSESRKISRRSFGLMTNRFQKLFVVRPINSALHWILRSFQSASTFYSCSITMYARLNILIAFQSEVIIFNNFRVRGVNPLGVLFKVVWC